jgi:hypothetical protein
MRHLKPEFGCSAAEGKEERKKEAVVRFNTFSSMKDPMPSVTVHKATCCSPTLCTVLNTRINSLDRFERQLKEFNFRASKGILMYCRILSFF